jgi:hypothetical protein
MGLPGMGRRKSNTKSQKGKRKGKGVGRTPTRRAIGGVPNPPGQLPPGTGGLPSNFQMPQIDFNQLQNRKKP